MSKPSMIKFTPTRITQSNVRSIDTLMEYFIKLGDKYCQENGKEKMVKVYFKYILEQKDFNFNNEQRNEIVTTLYYKYFK